MQYEPPELAELRAFPKGKDKLDTTEGIERNLDHDWELYKKLFQVFEATEKGETEIFSDNGGDIDFDKMLAEAVRAWPYWMNQYEQITAELDYWRKLAELQDKLLTCYRFGRNPGKIIDKIDKVRNILKETKILTAR